MPAYIVANELSDNAYEAFDYILNTRATYELLGKAVVMLEGEAKTQHQSAPTELCRSINSYKDREWKRVCFSALVSARTDYRRTFGDSEDSPSWYKDINLKVEEVMACALVHRDHFPNYGLFDLKVGT